MSKFVKTVRDNREISLFLIDVFCIACGYLIGFVFRFIDNPATIVNYHAHFRNIILTLPFVIAINFVFFTVLKINKSLWKYVGLDEVCRICFASFVSNIIWFLIVYSVPVTPYIRSVPVIGMIFQIVLMLGVRFMYRLIHEKNIRKFKKNRALIIGAGSAGALLERDIRENDKFDANVVGFIDDNINLVGKRISGVEVLGTVDDIDKVIKKVDVDIAYIAIPSASKKRISEIITICGNLNLKTQIMDYQVRKNLEEVSTIREVSVEDLLGRNEITLDTESIHGYLENKVVMVTGGGGSIGSELCRQILKFNPRKLIVFDIYENNMYSLQQELLIKKRNGQLETSTELEFLIGSVRDSKRLNEVMSKYNIDVVFHAAAHKHVPLVESSPKEAIKNNVFGTYNTIQGCIKNKVGKFVLISTDKAVNPTNVMGCTKRITELIIQALKNNGVTKVGAVRFGNVLGSNGSVIPLFKEQIASGGPVTVTDPNIERYFMTIPEAAGLVLQAGAYANNGEIFVLDMGTRVKILSLAENMIKLSGLKPYADIDIEFVGLRPGEKMYEEISLGNEKRYKTENNRIFVNEPMKFDEEKFLNELREFEQFIDASTNEEMSKKVFGLVEEYK